MNYQTAITEFLHHCRFEKRLSPKTLQAYLIDLTQLKKFLLQINHSMCLSEITKLELKGFMESLSSLKPKSVKRKMAAVKALFNYLEYEDKIALNPLRKMRILIKEAKVLPVVMNINEINTIFKSAYSENEKIQDQNSYSYLETLRNIVIVELLFATGARVSEIASILRANIDIDSGIITIKGKGDKERVLQVCHKESLRALKKYYKIGIKKIEQSGGFFLVNRFGNKISDQSIRTIVKYHSRKAGIKKHITPHNFRHSFATLLLENDVDIKYIQTLLGHSSILTTQIYTHVNREKQKQILKLKHPRKKFTMRTI